MNIFNRDLPNGVHVWHNRDYWFNIYDINMLYLHPVKLSFCEKNLTKRGEFCRNIIAAFRDNLWQIENNSAVTLHYNGSLQVWISSS